MTTTTKLAGLALAVGIARAAGCVPNEKYEALRIRAEGLETQAQQAQAQADAAEARAQAVENQLGSAAGGSQGLQDLLRQERDRNEQLRADYQQLQDAYDTLGEGGGVALPAPVVTDLNRFAAANPDLVSFDAERGIVRFESDLTFASGSAQLKDGAAGAIDRFAGILTGETASGYELMIAGHTDNVPVSNARTKQAHPNNWYLSAHRAITVAEAMRRAGVAKNRLGVAGYADQRPVSSNDTASGRAQNRRVEVLILPTRAPDAVEPGVPGADDADGVTETPSAEIEFEEMDAGDDSDSK